MFVNGRRVAVAADFPETVVDANAVLYTEQELTEEQKAQARKNIGAAQQKYPIDYSVYFYIDNDGVVSLKPEYRGKGNASYEYSISKNGVGAVGSKNSELPEVLVIPDIVNKITVTALAPGMFMLNNAVKSITIPSHITEIPEMYCAQARALEEIHGIQNIEVIGKVAFRETRLKNVAFPRLREFSGVQQFANCVYLVSADIGDNIIELPAYCFYYCESLESILGGANVTKIGEMALRGTHRLKKVSFAPNLKEIGNHGFNASGLNHYWHTHYGCTFGTYATPAQWNPTDFWSGCTYTPCVTQLRSTFHQGNPAWNDAALANVTDLTDTEKGYVDNCVTNAAAMAYSALEGVDLSSPADFIRAVKAVAPSITANYSVSDPAGTRKYFEALGYETEQYAYGDNLQRLYDALAEGHLVIGTILSQSVGWNSHAALFYGVTEKGEIMACDTENYRKVFGDYTAVTYAKRIQNMVLPVRTSNGAGTKELFTIVKKKEE